MDLNLRHAIHNIMMDVVEMRLKMNTLIDDCNTLLKDYPVEENTPVPLSGDPHGHDWITKELAIGVYSTCCANCDTDFLNRNGPCKECKHEGYFPGKLRPMESCKKCGEITPYPVKEQVKMVLKGDTFNKVMDE